MKIRPENITYLENHVKGFLNDITTLASRVKPAFVRIETSFQYPGVKIKKMAINKEANTISKMFLKMFQEDNNSVEQFDEFEIIFADKDGESHVFDLIKGKREIIVKIERKKAYTVTQYYNMILEKFNQFIATFK